jgi:hypothetical protein
MGTINTKKQFAAYWHVQIILYKSIFTTGQYPESFGEGIIKPTYKGGDKENPQNYRGINLINIISQIYSQILLNHLTNWTQTNETIIENQFGFPAG